MKVPAGLPDRKEKQPAQLCTAVICGSCLSPDTAHEWQSWGQSLYGFEMFLFKD